MKDVLYKKISDVRSQEIDTSKMRKQYIRDVFLSMFANAIPYSIKTKIKHVVRKNKG